MFKPIVLLAIICGIHAKQPTIIKGHGYGHGGQHGGNNGGDDNLHGSHNHNTLHHDTTNHHTQTHDTDGHASASLTSVIQSLNSAECGSTYFNPAVSYIVGGTEARPNSWPWMVSLMYNGYHVCGGSLISDRYIVTAAHCVEGNMGKPSRWRVRLGIHDRSASESTEQNLGLKAIISHGQYDSANINNDIAIMEIDGTATINEYVRPVCITGDDVAAGTSCVTTGWGDTQGTGSSLVLRQVTVPIISQSTCSSGKYYGRYMDTTTMICAGYEQGGRDSCQGDSGGPLVCSSGGRWYLTGITSWGFGCADAYKPGVYTRVVHYGNWLANNAA